MQSVKQEPIYLPDVESNPQPGAYKDMTPKKAKQRRTVLADLASPCLPPGNHDSPGTFYAGHHAPNCTDQCRVARADCRLHFRDQQCEFWMKSHAAVSSELLGESFRHAPT
jgi:hypothetical protein